MAAITAPERTPAQNLKATETNPSADYGGYYLRHLQEIAKATECK
jgi:hypothetical protein